MEPVTKNQFTTKKCSQQNLARVVSLSRELKELHQSCMIVPSSPKNHKSPPFLTFFHQYNSYRFVPMDNSIDSMPECLQMTYCKKKNVSKYCPIPSFAYKYRCIKVLNITLVQSIFQFRQRLNYKQKKSTSNIANLPHA